MIPEAYTDAISEWLDNMHPGQLRIVEAIANAQLRAWEALGVQR